jgi:hypothetical protein
MKHFYKRLYVYHYIDIACDVFVAYRRLPACSEISCVRTE